MKAIDRYGHGGFTLVETVVVGALAGVFAIGTFTVFNMYVSAQDETAAMLRLQRQADGLTDEIGRRVRGAGAGGAGFILGGGESLSVLFFDESNPLYDPVYDGADADTTPVVRVDTIVIMNGADVSVSFRINAINDAAGAVQIREGGAGGGWSDFMVDGSRIEVVTGPAGGVGRAGRFGLWRGRKRVSIDIVLTAATKGGKTLTLNVQRGTFVCRN